MAKETFKTIGNISLKTAEEFFVLEYIGKPIVQSLGLYKHIAKHAEEYISVDSLNCTTDSIADIVNDYDEIYYDKKRKSFEFYKKLIESVCVVITYHVKKDYFYVATVFPVSQNKIDNRKYKKAYDKYVINNIDTN